MTSKNKHKLSFDAIGTLWSIETERLIDENLQDLIERRIQAFDQAYSRFREDSLVAKIAEKAGEYDFPADAEKLIGFYRALYDATDGAVSPLVGDALVQAGYDRSYSLLPGHVVKAPAWGDVMEWRGAHVTTGRPATLDFGAAGKGYLVDIVGELLEHGGHTNYVVDASGDIRVRGHIETVGLENPYDSDSVISTTKVENASLCASATNRRTWGEWHHVIDPRTARPVSNVVATWVHAATTMEADGLATALFFVGPDVLQHWEFQYVRLLANGRIEHSPNFVGQLYL